MGEVHGPTGVCSLHHSPAQGSLNSATTLTLTYLFLDNFPLLPAPRVGLAFSRKIQRHRQATGQRQIARQTEQHFRQSQYQPFRIQGPGCQTDFTFWSLTLPPLLRTPLTAALFQQGRPSTPSPSPQSQPQRSAIFPGKTTPLSNNWKEGRRGEGVRKTGGAKENPKISLIPLPDAVSAPTTTMFPVRAVISYFLYKRAGR